MNGDNFLIYNGYHKICKTICRILHCNLLWITRLDFNNSLTMLVTDTALLNYYLDKQYYLEDPQFKLKLDQNHINWNTSLGTDSETFSQNGFLYDLQKKFHIEEFVSIEKQVTTARYCYRFFTRNNRFVFVSKLFNDMPIVKCFINETIGIFQPVLDKQSGIKLSIK